MLFWIIGLVLEKLWKQRSQDVNLCNQSVTKEQKSSSWKGTTDSLLHSPDRAGSQEKAKLEDLWLYYFSSVVLLSLEEKSEETITGAQTEEIHIFISWFLESCTKSPWFIAPFWQDKSEFIHEWTEWAKTEIAHWDKNKFSSCYPLVDAIEVSTTSINTLISFAIHLFPLPWINQDV